MFINTLFSIYLSIEYFQALNLCEYIHFDAWSPMLLNSLLKSLESIKYEILQNIFLSSIQTTIDQAWNYINIIHLQKQYNNYLYDWMPQML
jgi:hypothetical protein